MKLHAAAACFVALLRISSLHAAAQERRIDRATLPAAVEKTVATNSRGATIKAFTTERENGKRVYEAEMVVDGHTKDIQVAEDGSLNEIEEEVALTSLRPEVQAALKARARAVSTTIVKVEKITKKDKLVAYEASTLRGTRKGEFQVGPDGKTLAHAE